MLAKAEEFGGADYELVDIVDFNLPILDEPFPAAYQNYQNDHTKAFAAKMSEFDGYIFIVGEYNHSVQPALANALSYLNAELNNKAAGMVGYGSAIATAMSIVIFAVAGVMLWLQRRSAREEAAG